MANVLLIRTAPGAALALVAALAGCYAPKVPDCAYSCQSDTQCPSGLVCDMAQGACRAAGATGTCGAVADGGADATHGDARTDGQLRDAMDDAAVDAPVDASALAPWKIVQSNGSAAGAVALKATLAGNALIVAGQFNSLGLVSVSDDGGDKFALLPGSTAIFDGAGSPGVELWYANNINPNTTVVTAIGQGGQTDPAVVWEVSGLATIGGSDAGVTLSNQAATVSPASPLVTTTRGGELIITATDFETGEVSLGAGFTEDSHVGGDGWAHLSSASAPAGSYRAQWTVSNPGRYCATAAAFVTGPP